MPPRLTLTLHATNESVSRAADAVRDFLDHHGVRDAIVQDLMIIFDELASNIVRYAWCERHDHAFEAELALLQAEAASSVHLTLTDDGTPFDPTATPPPPPVETLDDLAPGGHGLALVRALSDGMTYTRTAGRNQIQVCKRLIDPGAPSP